MFSLAYCAIACTFEGGGGGAAVTLWVSDSVLCMSGNKVFVCTLTRPVKRTHTHLRARAHMRPLTVTLLGCPQTDGGHLGMFPMVILDSLLKVGAWKAAVKSDDLKDPPTDLEARARDLCHLLIDSTRHEFSRAGSFETKSLREGELTTG